MTAAAVEVVGLVKRYGGTRGRRRALTSPSRPGSVTAVLGPNGAGKTTTVEICEGYRRAGRRHGPGARPRPGRDARALRPRVGVMLQAGGVYPGVRAGEMLRHVAALHAHPLDPATLCSSGSASADAGAHAVPAALRRPAAAAVARPRPGRPPRAGLPRRADRRPGPAGPPGHLGAGRGRCARDGVTVVLTTHFMDEAERLADEVVVVDHGRVVAAGTPAELTGAGRARTAALHARRRARPRDAARRAARRDAGEEPPPAQLRGRRRRRPAAARRPSPPGAPTRGVMPEGLAVERRTLEDVFLELTGRELRA